MCRLCVKRRAALAGALAAIVLPARALDTIEPRFHRAPSPDGRRRVALTLDACNGGFDRRIADAIVAHRARATIFATADWLRANPANLAWLLAHPAQFSFQNHGRHHIPPVLGEGTLWGLRIAGTLEAARTEIIEGAAAIQAATGTRPRWYRAAAARYSPAVLPEIARLGFSVAAYSLNADEGASLPAATVAARVGDAKDGDTIIGHVNQPHRGSGDGLARGIADLAVQGVVWSDLDAMQPRIK